MTLYGDKSFVEINCGVHEDGGQSLTAELCLRSGSAPSVRIKRGNRYVANIHLHCLRSIVAAANAEARRLKRMHPRLFLTRGQAAAERRRVLRELRRQGKLQCYDG